MSTYFASYMRFMWAGLIKHPQTGGIVPSQRFLIDKMLEPIPMAYGGLILELGAGNGALTLRLAARCAQAGILACELNPGLARDARQKLAAAGCEGRVEVRSDSAERVLSARVDAGLAPLDFIVSGIPLGNLGRERALGLIELAGRALARTGMFIQFQHSLLDRRKLRGCFSRLRTALVLLNFPPAVVYYAQGPI